MTAELRRDVLLPLVVLMAIVVLTSAGTVALLARMAPAIEQIIAENVYSLEAAEEMLSVVASGSIDEAARQRFDSALARAANNITEQREEVVLEGLRTDRAALFGGDPGARTRVIDNLRALGEINRGAAIRSDTEAQRLGYASAWAAVFLGAISFAWGLIAIRRARRRLIDPLHEVAAVLEAARTGDRYRRTRRIAAPAELERIMSGVDDLLDARTLRRWAEEPAPRAVADRAVLLHLLEARPNPTFVVNVEGTIEAANRAGLALLHAESASVLHDRLRRAVGGDRDEFTVEEIGEPARWLCELTG